MRVLCRTAGECRRTQREGGGVAASFFEDSRGSGKGEREGGGDECQLRTAGGGHMTAGWRQGCGVVEDSRRVPYDSRMAARVRGGRRQPEGAAGGRAVGMVERLRTA